MKNINHSKEQNRFLKRNALCAIVVGILFFVMFIRLFDLQIISYHFYETLSKQNIISVVSVKPNRGLIYDRNGILLADNTPVYSLMIIPGRVDHLKNVIDALIPIVHLTPDDIQTFYHTLKQYRRYQAVPLKEKLTEAEVDAFYVDQYRFPGVIVQANMMRHYPLGAMIANVIGYVGRINSQELTYLNSDNYTASDYVGKSGIEKEYEPVLHGSMGAETAEINAAGKIVRVLKQAPPLSGKNIYVTIDSALQALAEKALGNNSGAIVALQPLTGQVLAMVSKPNVDPNLLVNGLDQATYQQLLHAPHHPLFNRATRGLYSPGSTVKPFIAVSALNDGVVHIEDKLVDQGVFQLPNSTHIYHDWKKGGHGVVNITKAIIVSCDIFFYKLATLLGIERIDQALSQFGFGQKTGIDFPDERRGILPSPTWKESATGKTWYPGDTVLTGIGQGYLLVTPLQLALATATLAERGQKMQPNLLLKIENSDGSITETTPILKTPVDIHNPIAWNTVISAMQGVIQDPQGTASAFGKEAPYSVAAKTGTAQIFGLRHDEEKTRTDIPKQLRDNHLFICFAPVDHPEIAIAIVIEHANMADHIARTLLDFYFNELKQQQKNMPIPLLPKNIPSPTSQQETSDANPENKSH